MTPEPQPPYVLVPCVRALGPGLSCWLFWPTGLCTIVEDHESIIEVAIRTLTVWVGRNPRAVAKMSSQPGLILPPGFKPLGVWWMRVVTTPIGWAVEDDMYDFVEGIPQELLS